MDINLLRWSIRDSALVGFSRSGGPGGQNVNKVNTKVTLHLDLKKLEGLNEVEIHRLGELLESRLSEKGELVISSSEERSQRINLERAYIRAETLVEAAARIPKKRRPTKPSAAAREKRLRSKRFQGEKKAGRRSPSGEE